LPERPVNRQGSARSGRPSLTPGDPRAGGKSVGSIRVAYYANGDFIGGIAFAYTVVDGIRDASTPVAATTSNYP
jgi:hypothetical protein